MPFPDELTRGLAVVAYDRRWPGDFAVLARRIQDALGPMTVRVSHVGSTSVPGLAAKDCIDVQVEVQALKEELIVGRFGKIGFRLRPSHGIAWRLPPGSPCPSWSSPRPRASGRATFTWRRPAAMATDIYQYGRPRQREHPVPARSWHERPQRRCRVPRYGKRAH